MLGTALLILLGTAELLPRTVLPLLLMLVLMQGKYCAAGARCRAETASNAASIHWLCCCGCICGKVLCFVKVLCNCFFDVLFRC
jgi:hypothetical protein